MILCLIILIAGLICLAAGVISAYILRGDFFTTIGIFLLGCGIVATMVSATLLVVLPIQKHQTLNEFLSQKEYIESYEPTSGDDANAIFEKKIELNSWLYGEQHIKKTRPICSFYGDEILELESIK